MFLSCENEYIILLNFYASPDINDIRWGTLIISVIKIWWVSLVNLEPNCSFEEDIKMLMIDFYELLSDCLFWGHSYTMFGEHMDKNNPGSLKMHACFAAISKWTVQWVALKCMFNTWPWPRFYYDASGTVRIAAVQSSNVRWVLPKVNASCWKITYPNTKPNPKPW